MTVFRAIALPFVTALQVADSSPVAGRWFIAYLARGSQRWLLGHPVVDEFGTFSSPIFVSPAALLGTMYGFGITLGHRRDPEMAIDLGWPPLCVGVDEPAPVLPAGWEATLSAALDRPWEKEVADSAVESRAVGEWVLSRWSREGVTVIGVSAPLLPRQLRRLCEVVDSPVTIGFATGNRIRRSDGDGPIDLQVVSERWFENDLLRSLKAKG